MAAKENPTQRSLDIVREHIKNESYSKVYLLFGEENYLVRQNRDMLLNELKDEMNFSSYVGETCDVNSICSDITTLPFLAPHRVTLVEDSGYFKKSPDERLINTINEQGEENILIFCEKEVDKRLTLYKTVGKVGTILEFDEPSESMLISWIGMILSEGEMQVQRGVPEYILNAVGNDMSSLKNEATKLHDYCLETKKITVKEAEEICVGSIEDKIFVMCDAIGEGKSNVAVNLYNDLVQLRVPNMKILSLLTRHFNILAQVKLMDSEKKSFAEMAKVAGIPPFSVKRYFGQANKFSYDKLLRMVDLCQDMDLAIKQGRLVDRDAVEKIIIVNLK